MAGGARRPCAAVACGGGIHPTSSAGTVTVTIETGEITTEMLGITKDATDGVSVPNEIAGGSASLGSCSHMQPGDAVLGLGPRFGMDVASERQHS